MNTHQKYQTQNHTHMDWQYQENSQFEYPRSALMLVQAGDGRWFVEQEFGTEYSGFDGVLKSSNDLDTDPTFYPNEDAAATAAFGFMKQIYPGYADEQLASYLADE